MIKASDPSISVRDAVLEFISKLIFTPHELNVGTDAIYTKNRLFIKSKIY